MEIWLLVAVAAALLTTGYHTLQKHLTVEYSGLELGYVTSVLGCLFLLPIGAWMLVTGDVTVTRAVLLVILLSGAVNVAAYYAFLTALTIEDLSVIAPLVQLSPILVALSEPALLGIAFEPVLVVGAGFAVAGSFVLLTGGRSVLAPVVHVSTRAAVLALAAACCFTVAALANRYVTIRMEPLLYAFFVYTLMSIGFAVVLAVRRERVPPTSLLRVKLLSLGGLTSLRTTVTYYAFSLAAASRVSVVLQLAIVLSVFAGVLLFREEHLRRKSIGAVLIVSGVYLVV